MSGLFGSPKVPQVAVAAPMPDANSPAVIEAQKQQTAAALSRSGRQSTILGLQAGQGPGQGAAPQRADAFSGKALGAGQ